MNKYNVKLLTGMLLAAALVSPVAFADPDDVAAINNMNDNIGNILKTQVGDLTRNQLAAALINYEAAAKVQEFQYNQQLLFMAAPGSVWAIQAGGVIGVSDPSTASVSMANNVLTNYFNVSGNGLTPVQLYQQIQNFINAGGTDATQATAINAAAIVQADNLTKVSPTPISSAQAQSFINILTNPFPATSAAQTKIQNKQPLTGADMEALGHQAAQYAVVGVSASALSDMVARRLPVSGQTQSVMEIMDQYSNQRFTNPGWYAQIAAASDTALLREITHMMAYNTWVSYEQFRVSEQTMVLLASLNSVMAAMNASLVELNTSMKAAQAQSSAANLQLQQQVQQNQISPGDLNNGTITIPTQ